MEECNQLKKALKATYSTLDQQQLEATEKPRAGKA